MTSPTHKPIIDYFESLNAALKDFPEKSFFRMDLSEINGAFRTGIGFPALGIESPELDTEGSNINNSVVGRTFAFTVYVNPRQGNYERQNLDLDLAEKIGWKIIARMRHDARNPESLLYNKFDSSAVSAIKIGPVFTEMLYGYRFTGTIRGSESLKLDPADWGDIETTC